MTKIDLSAYEEGFKPKFNQKRYNELLDDTPTRFKCNGKEINIPKELVKTMLVGCAQLTQKVDENNILTGDEGSGKSHYSFQLAFVKHRLMTELGMIAYPFTLDLIYYNVKQILVSFDDYAHIPYMIYVLDESDTLTRNKWNDPIVKQYISKLRRERKNLRIVYMNMPQLSELLPTVTLTRVTLIFEIRIETKEGVIKRGKFNLFCIPRGSEAFSTYFQNYIDKQKIKNIIAKKLYATEERYFTLPREILITRGNFNAVSPIDEKEYLIRARESNKEDTVEDSVVSPAEKVRVDDERYNRVEAMRRLKFTWDVIGQIYDLTKDSARMWSSNFEKRKAK